MSEPLWVPPPELLRSAALAQLAREVGAEDYEALWHWSVADVARFWRHMWGRWGIACNGSPNPALADRSMPGARWFPGVALSYPEHVFRDRDPEAVALYASSETLEVAPWSWAELLGETRRIRAGLRDLGVARGDRVAAYLPNVPHTLAAFLATTSLGAIWSCCSPDFGAGTVALRFAQIAPKVVLATDGYRYGGRDFPRTDTVNDLRGALPTLQDAVTLGTLEKGDWDSVFAPTDEPLEFERVPFDWPLWIVYSSGTTGPPKAIVHGHGGPLLESLKTWQLTHDLRPGDRAFWFTTTGWIMWNYLVGALLSGVSIVVYDGNPSVPDPDALWQLAEAAGVHVFGTGAAYIHGCMKAGVQPRSNGRRLESLRSIGSTGSPLSAEGFEWIRDELGAAVWTCSTSGGTDVAGAFLGGVPTKPVYSGELSARLLGVAVEAWDEQGNPLVDEVGELVVTAPMPSMPVSFWSDPSGVRYRDSYFSTYPGVWRHGDWVRITRRGSAIIYGRSDSTINRGGIRIGTAEIYSALAELPEVKDAMAVDVPLGHDASESRLTLFLVTDELDDQLVSEARQRIRAHCSPRHVPDLVVRAPGVPRTLTGKLLEVPVKRLLMGHDASSVAVRDTLQDAEVFDWYVRYARQHSARA